MGVAGFSGIGRGRGAQQRSALSIHGDGENALGHQPGGSRLPSTQTGTHHDGGRDGDRTEGGAEADRTEPGAESPAAP